MMWLSWLRCAASLLLVLGVLQPQYLQVSDVVGASSQETAGVAAVVSPALSMFVSAAKAESPTPATKKHHRTRIADSKHEKQKRREAHVKGVAQKQTERAARTNTVHMNRDNMEQTKRRHADL
jgi:hypothetical protein